MQRTKPTTVVTLMIAALAFIAILPTGAAAAEFRMSSLGSLSGEQTTDHVFTTTGGKYGAVTCKKAAVAGTITSIAFQEQDYIVNYSQCSAFGFAQAYVSSPEVTLHASGTVDLKSAITVSVPVGFCSLTISPQDGLQSVSYTNHYPEMEASKALTGLTYTSSGGFCGSSGTDGAYSGSTLIKHTTEGEDYWWGG